MLDADAHKQIAGLRSKVDPVTGLPGSVLFIQSLIEQTGSRSDEEIGSLYLALANEFDRANRPEDAVDTLREYVREFPDSVPALVALSGTLKRKEGSIEEARELVASAVRYAKTANCYLRYALGAQARLARQIEDADLYRRTLEELVGDSEQQRTQDVGFEDDFLVDLPDRFVPDELLKDTEPVTVDEAELVV